MENDWLDRLLDALYLCPCDKCKHERAARLMHDLQVEYGCTTMAQYEAKRQRMD